MLSKEKERRHVTGGKKKRRKAKEKKKRDMKCGSVTWEDLDLRGCVFNICRSHPFKIGGAQNREEKKKKREKVTKKKRAVEKKKTREAKKPRCRLHEANKKKKNV